MSFELLSEPIRKYIRYKRWEQLRPIQTAAIAKILTTDDNYILASRTASGKTEAAFLPIISKVNFNEEGIQVLYISPLIALINDQFYRIEELCKTLEVPVTKWHGEANKTLKNRIIKNPKGIVLITPESLEAMFVNRPYNIRLLFANLKYVVIDEIHSFIGTDRGVHLRSILYRLQKNNSKHFNIIGLSATIGDYNEAKKFTGEEQKTKVLLDRSVNQIIIVFRYFKSEGNELPLDLLKDLYIETKDNKVLIFPNSRGRAEEISVKLRKISDRVNGHPNYFSHHSSVDKEIREYVEYFAKNNNRQNFCISCTSTLELGIDIGTIDEVIQIDATHSIASLIQRVGRSGRKEGEKGNLYLYATNQWSLLQSMACWLLYQEGFIEPFLSTEKPYDLLIHQALSITKEHSGIYHTELIKQLRENFAFNKIEENEVLEIINHLIEIDLFEKLQEELIIGLEGEKIVNSRDFYSVFKTEENFKVANAGRIIGEIPLSPQIKEDENIYLAARIWKIKYIDFKAKKILVDPTLDGKKPTFFGGGSTIHHRIREKMLEILYNNIEYEFLDQPSCEELEKMRKDFSIFHIQDIKTDRPLLSTAKDCLLSTFTGTRINRTIQLLFNIAGIKNTLDDNSSSIEIEINRNDLIKKWNSLLQPLSVINNNISNLLSSSPALLDFSKWGKFLPMKYQVNLMKNKYYDIEQTEHFLESVKIIDN
jgi:ATP-dependent helicase Lhr and Lhr-like helicase